MLLMFKSKYAGTAIASQRVKRRLNLRFFFINIFKVLSFYLYTSHSKTQAHTMRYAGSCYVGVKLGNLPEERTQTGGAQCLNVRFF
jgi:hypothetical protein